MNTSSKEEIIWLVYKIVHLYIIIKISQIDSSNDEKIYSKFFSVVICSKNSQVEGSRQTKGTKRWQVKEWHNLISLFLSLLFLSMKKIPAVVTSSEQTWFFVVYGIIHGNVHQEFNFIFIHMKSIHIKYIAVINHLI